MTQVTALPRKAADHGYEAVHESEREWETLRFDGTQSKMLFHPRPERPTEPNAGFVRYQPGTGYPLHRHDFAQIWYILEGRFHIGGREYGPGTMIFHPDPHYEDEFRTETGGEILIVQYPGPNTGGRPVYDDRFNLTERRPVAAERTDR